MHPHEVEEMPTSLRFWRWEKFTKVVKPMDASLLHLYWPLTDWDQPYRATGQPSSMRPRFFVHATVLILDGPTDWPHKSSTWTLYVFQGPVAKNSSPALLTFDHALNTNSSFFSGQLSLSLDKAVSILTPIIRTPVNADTVTFFCSNSHRLLTPINRFSDLRKLTSIIWHFVINQLCAVLILASDEVILGCQHFDVYSVTVDGIRWSGDVNFWLFKVINEFNTQRTVFD